MPLNERYLMSSVELELTCGHTVLYMTEGQTDPYYKFDRSLYPAQRCISCRWRPWGGRRLTIPLRDVARVRAR